VDEGVDCGGSAVLFLDLPVASAAQEEEDTEGNEGEENETANDTSSDLTRMGWRLRELFGRIRGGKGGCDRGSN